MAGFKTHVSVSGSLGVIYGTYGYACGLPLSTAAVGAGICTIGGMLPDLDGDTGVAVREIVPLVATVIPVLMLDIFKHWGFDREGIFLAIVGLYVLIRFGIGTPFKRLTHHRGMWHSIPAAISVGLICLIVCSYQEFAPRMFKASAITLGFLSHLILDEIWSIKMFRSKKSEGTAFKLFTPGRLWPNLITYGIMFGLLGTLCFKDRDMQHDFYAWRSGDLVINLKPDLSRFGLGKSPVLKSDATLEESSSRVGKPPGRPKEIQLGEQVN